MFTVPWRDLTLIGVWHTLFPEYPDAAVAARTRSTPGWPRSTVGYPHSS